MLSTLVPPAGTFPARLPAGLDPVRPAADPRRGAGRHPQGGLGQYRRDQRAAHRPQGAGGRDPAARCAEGRRGGADRRASSASWRAVGAAAGAVLGHMFPVWLSFKGGKGMATTLGVMWGLSWPVGAIACAAWLAFAALFRYSSLATLLSILVGGDRRVVPDRSAGGHAAHPAGAAGVGAPPRRTSAGCWTAPSPRSASAARPRAPLLQAREAVGTPVLAADAVVDEEQAFGIDLVLDLRAAADSSSPQKALCQSASK